MKNCGSQMFMLEAPSSHYVGIIYVLFFGSPSKAPAKGTALNSENCSRSLKKVYLKIFQEDGHI